VVVTTILVVMTTWLLWLLEDYNNCESNCWVCFDCLRLRYIYKHPLEYNHWAFQLGEVP